MAVSRPKPLPPPRNNSSSPVRILPLRSLFRVFGSAATRRGKRWSYVQPPPGRNSHVCQSHLFVHR
jgi:hypothetical protein